MISFSVDVADNCYIATVSALHGDGCSNNERKSVSKIERRVGGIPEYFYWACSEETGGILKNPDVRIGPYISEHETVRTFHFGNDDIVT